MNHFDGETYDHARDGVRLNAQQADVFNVMRDGQRRTLEDISIRTGHPMQSVSARLRDFRKARFGSHTVNRYNMGGGLYEYQLVINRT